MKVYIQKSCFVLVAISMLYTVFPVSRADAQTTSSATANMIQVPFSKSVNPVKASQYSAAYVAVPSVNCKGMSIRACEAASAQARAVQPPPVRPAVQPPPVRPAVQPPPVRPAVQPPAVQPAVQPPPVRPAVQPPAVQPPAVQPPAVQPPAGPRLTEIQKPVQTPSFFPSYIPQTQAAAAQAARTTVAPRQPTVVRPVTTTIPARPVTTTAPVATNANPDTNCAKIGQSTLIQRLCTSTAYSDTATQNLGIVHNFPSNSAKICTPQQIKNNKDCHTNSSTSSQIASSAATLNSAINNSTDPNKTTVISFEGFNTAAAGSGTNNKENATTRAISSAAQACNNSNPPTYSALNRLDEIERTTDKCVIFYISPDVNVAKRAEIEAKCIAAAQAANLACAIAYPRQDATNGNFNKAGFRATTASVRTITTTSPPPSINVCSRATSTLINIITSNYSDALHYMPTNDGCDLSPPPPPPSINVCSRATRTLINIITSNYSDALHYMPTNGRCDPTPPPPPPSINVCSRATRTLINIITSNYSDALYYMPTNGRCTTGGNPGAPGGQNGTPGTPGGQNGTPGTPGGQNDTPGAPGGQNGTPGTPGGQNGTPDYSDWPDYTLDPETREPWVVEVRVDTIAPTYYVANGKKTSLSHTVQVLCGVNKEICTEDKHGIVYTSPKITATQSSTDPKFVACASPKETKCAYYAPKNEKVVSLDNGNTTWFDIYFYTPLPATASALTTLAVDITVNRIIEFGDEFGPEIVNVDDVEGRFYINGNPSSYIVYRKVLGSRG